MRMIRFGRTNAQVPAISLGTWGHGGPHVNNGASVGWTGHDDRAAKGAIVAAYRSGITHWDTADAYGNGHAEQLIGEVFAEGVPRNEIFLATKFGWVKGPHDHFYDAGFMREQCERSLRLMNTEVIDLYYFHHCDFGPNDEYFDDALATMRKLRDEGKVRFIGLSDWDARKIMRFIERVDPDVVQPFRNLMITSRAVSSHTSTRTTSASLSFPRSNTAFSSASTTRRRTSAKATSAAASPNSATPNSSPACAAPPPKSRSACLSFAPSPAPSSPATRRRQCSSASAIRSRSPPRRRRARR
jgi:aryl-alcohol dehydrogenase-like predicted oxidoreductase